ncbi:MAG: hypothetical protein ISP71_01980 [Flavobacteriales bacterium]|nr:hypothetical protein [Flavobacteriales bacterium]
MNVKIELINGYFKTNICLDKTIIDESFKTFMSRHISYRKNFLQTEYNYAFDGYSYMGQKNSTNQYAHDSLHSFVVSDFQAVKNYPIEFHPFLNTYWNKLTSIVKAVEHNLLHKMLVQSEIIQFHEKNVGHMMSLNFYPIVKKENTKRLSIHKDVSLISIFPFGISRELFIIDENGNEIKIPATKNLIAFPGFLIELLSKGRIKALQHYVNYDESINQERYSYVIFSIPKPYTNLPIININSENYFKKYLSLF